MKPGDLLFVLSGFVACLGVATNEPVPLLAAIHAALLAIYLRGRTAWR